jgi:cytochrome b6-f complex iron-sulfur subunit
MESASMALSSSRRRFLKIIAVGAAGAAGASCGSPGSAESIGDVDAGNVKNLPVGTLRAVGSEAVAIGRDKSGVYAMTLTCTHAGCNMATQGQVSNTGAECGCHGSIFDVNGAVVAGPARAPLEHFAVEISAAGEITIHGDTSVSAATRVAAPA